MIIISHNYGAHVAPASATPTQSHQAKHRRTLEHHIHISQTLSWTQSLYPVAYALYNVSKNPLAKSTTTLLLGKLPATPHNAAASPFTAPLAPLPSAILFLS